MNSLVKDALFYPFVPAKISQMFFFSFFFLSIFLYYIRLHFFSLILL